jgi:hypothetical protein
MRYGLLEELQKRGSGYEDNKMQWLIISYLMISSQTMIESIYFNLCGCMLPA